MNPAPRPPAGAAEEVAVPQQPYQNHSSRYLPSFLGSCLASGRLTLLLCSGLQLFYPYLYRARPNSVSHLFVPPSFPQLCLSLRGQNIRAACDDEVDDDAMPELTGTQGVLRASGSAVIDAFRCDAIQILM